MNAKDLLIDFLTHCREHHTLPVVKSHIEPIVEKYLSSKNIGNTLVRRSYSSQCLSGIKPIVKLEQKLLRRKTGDVDTWVQFTVNSTYLPLIIEFPDDYRQLDGSPLPMEVTQ